MATQFNTNLHIKNRSTISATQTEVAPELLDLQRLVQKVSGAASSPSSDSTPPNNNKKRISRDENEASPESDGKAKKALFKPEFAVTQSTGALSPSRFISPKMPHNQLISPQINTWGLSQETDPTPPPATPMKKKTASSHRLAAPVQVSPFQVNQELLSSGKFKIEVNVNAIDSGSYSTVYEISNWPGVVLKAFHGRKMSFDEAHLTGLLIQMGLNYKEIVTLDLPVATVHNLDKLVTEKYVLQERIPHALDRTNQLQMAQVQKFFAASITHDVMMDLQPQNFRVRDNGTVVLIDFVEEADDVSVFIIKACKEWIEACSTREEAEKLLAFLTANHYDQTWINEVLGKAD